MLPAIRDDLGKIDTRGHRDRIVHIDRDALSSIHVLIEDCTVPVYFVKRPVDFGSRLRANENDSDKKLYGSLDQRDERSVMA